MKKDKYTEGLEEVVKQMLVPYKKIPFNLVIEVLSGCNIIPFNNKDKKDIVLIKKLIKAVSAAGENFNKNGVLRSRPNEVGNDIESFVKQALNDIKYKAGTPLTSKGGKKSTGYPDIEFTDEFHRVNYLECKTFNIKNISTTQRSFYLSPSENFKITKDAHHFVVSFEIYEAKSVGKNSLFKCKSWKILAIENLQVDVKYEFNADNARLYASEMVIAQGKI